MADAKVIVSAENRLKQGLDDAKKDLLGFGDAAEAIGNKLKNALTVTAVVVGLEKLGKAAFDCFVEFGEGERRIKQLKIALDNNETSFNRATRLIDEMRGMSLASKDQIEGLVAELAALGKSDEEIDKITRAAVNLSNVTGQDLNTAFTLINGTYSGTAGKLEKLIPELGDLTKEQLAAGEAADIINGKFGEMSKQLAEDNIPQKIKNIQDGWGDLKENLGEAVAPLFNPILDGINRIIEGWNNAAKATDLHNQYLTAASYSQRIMIQEELVSVYEEQLRLFDQSNKATIDRIKKNIEQAKLTGDTQARMMAEDALAVWEGERAKIKTELDIAKASITDLKKEWAATPAAKLAPQDLIPKITLIAETKPAVKPEEKPEAKPEDELGKLVAGAIGKISDLWAPKGISPGIAGGLSFRVAPPSAEEYLAEIADNYESALRAGVENNIKLTQEASRTLAEIEKWAIYSYDAFIAEKTKSIYPSSIIEESLGEPGLSQGIAGGISFKAEIPSAEEYLNKIVEEYESTISEKTKPVYLSSQIAESWSKPVLSPGIAGGVSFRAEIPSAEEYWAKILEEAQTYEDYLEGLNKFKVLMDDAELKRQQEEVAQWEQDYLADKAFKILMDKAELERQEAEVEEWSKNYLADKQFKVLMDDAELRRQQAEVEEWIQTYLGEKAFKVMMDKAEQERQNKEVAEWSANYLAAQDEIKRLGVAAQQSIAQMERMNANASLVTKIFAKLIDVTDTVIENYVNVKDSIVQGADSAVYGMISEVMGALGMFGQMLAGVNPILAVLIPIAQGFVDIIGPAITAVLQPVMNVLTQFGQLVAQALLPIFDALLPILSLIASVMQTALAPVLSVVASVALVLSGVLDALNPILVLTAKAFTILIAPVEFIADLFNWVGGVISAFGTNVGIAIWNITHPFSQRGFVSGPGAFSSDAFSGLADRLAAIDELAANTGAISSSVTIPTSSTTIASQSASYRVQPITINIYQQAPVVGSDGMREFARMIRGEFDALGYLGA